VAPSWQMERIEVVRGLTPGTKTPGIVREKAFDTASVLFSKSTIAPGNVSAWHNHGDRELYGFTLRGRLILEYETDGEEKAQLQEGDFFHIPTGLVHRDINPDGKEDAVMLSILIGEGPALVNFEGPSRKE
jgi:quercetin dioxygenase-like cupin family protein